MKARAPLLVFAYGNPSRGDDAVGPELARRVETRFREAIVGGALEVLTDFQLQVEHALDLEGRELVYFADASIALEGQPFTLTRVVPASDAGPFSHALTPQALLHTYGRVVDAPEPECWLCAIGARDFELGASMSAAARENLEVAFEALSARLAGSLHPRAGLRPSRIRGVGITSSARR